MWVEYGSSSMAKAGFRVHGSRLWVQDEGVESYYML